MRNDGMTTIFDSSERLKQSGKEYAEKQMKIEHALIQGKIKGILPEGYEYRFYYRGSDLHILGIAEDGKTKTFEVLDDELKEAYFKNAWELYEK